MRYFLAYTNPAYFSMVKFACQDPNGCRSWRCHDSTGGLLPPQRQASRLRVKQTLKDNKSSPKTTKLSILNYILLNGS